MVRSRSQSPADSAEGRAFTDDLPTRETSAIAPATPDALRKRQSLDLSLSQFLRTVKGAEVLDRVAKAEKALHAAEVFSTEDLVGATAESIEKSVDFSLSTGGFNFNIMTISVPVFVA